MLTSSLDDIPLPAAPVAVMFITLPPMLTAVSDFMPCPAFAVMFIRQPGLIVTPALLLFIAFL